MKTPKSLLLVCVALVVSLTACKKDEAPSAALLPTITTITPPSGKAGTTVTITGTNFAITLAGNTVKFNNVDAAVTEATATSLKVTAPTSTTGAVTVTTAAGTATGPAFTYSAAVVNRTEQVNGITIKLYINANLSKADAKNILLMGSGNNESNPSIGSLTLAAQNELCSKLALENWVCAIVAYPAPPAVAAGYKNWNDISRKLVTDFSSVADGIVAKYGGSRAKTVMGGQSYTSYLAMNESKFSDSPIKDFAGILAACGATGTWTDAKYYLPVANIVCAGNKEGDMSGIGFDTDIKAKAINDRVKTLSKGVSDATCNSHCGGENSATWKDFMYNNAKLFVQ